MPRYTNNSAAIELGTGVAFLAIAFLFLVVCFAAG
jgi:hypothetical protein